MSDKQFVSIYFLLSFTDKAQLRPYLESLGKQVPLIYIITPTYKRPTRYPDFLRLLHTVLHLENIHWLIIEDGKTTDPVLEKLLSAYDIRYTYFAQKNNVDPKKRKKIKGVDQRNAALSWIRFNHNYAESAVLYFADDDNAYSLELFDEIRFTQKISIFPVGLLNDDIIVVGFGKQKKKYQRKFAVDMASFAINVDVLFKNPKLQFASNYSNGYLETKFLEQFTDLSELEPLADNCTKVKRI
ncbi:hypothetical protein FSP39_004291 [Pinctada imbricata]|uniref:Galactosylgalactosylxylosylprotein 3-beta-glucuronosyltransferase n=1 Tax=Pinctada imbricata TaxID=66713 RepID=A0AA88XD24_PINIB|nr:hypothetical protein FSP39_004291 [Pinctada imbricata]